MSGLHEVCERDYRCDVVPMPALANLRKHNLGSANSRPSDFVFASGSETGSDAGMS
jgi:hypothetical protein